MITFIYSVENSSPSRGYNQSITVWRLKKNVPSFIGSTNEISTASTKGPKGEAINIITSETKFKSVDGYNMDPSEFQLFEV